MVSHNPALDEVLLYYISLPILTIHLLVQKVPLNFLLPHRTPRYESGELAHTYSLLAVILFEGSRNASGTLGSWASTQDFRQLKEQKV